MFANETLDSNYLSLRCCALVACNSYYKACILRYNIHIICWFNSNSWILPLLSTFGRRVDSFKLEAGASRRPASLLNPAPLPRGIREFPSMIVLVYFVRRDAACASLLWWYFHFGIHSFTGRDRYHVHSWPGSPLRHVLCLPTLTYDANVLV